MPHSGPVEYDIQWYKSQTNREVVLILPTNQLLLFRVCCGKKNIVTCLWSWLFENNGLKLGWLGGNTLKEKQRWFLYKGSQGMKK